MTTLTDHLWKRYRETGDPEARALLLDQYLGLVHHCARELARKVSHVVEADDLVGAGTLGLIQALEGFDLSRGLVFSTYAMQRIRGAMLDELRSRDWMPRAARDRARKLAETIARLESHLGRAPEHQEIARALGVDLNTYWQKWANLGKRRMIPLDASGLEGVHASVRLDETLPDPRAEDPMGGVTTDELKGQLREAISGLPQQERMVLALYYYEELNLRQIGEVLHVTESRVSQIRSRALKRLRENTELAQAVI